jgi:hypothetical protein
MFITTILVGTGGTGGIVIGGTINPPLLTRT